MSGEAVPIGGGFAVPGLIWNHLYPYQQTAVKWLSGGSTVCYRVEVRVRVCVGVCVRVKKRMRDCVQVCVGVCVGVCEHIKICMRDYVQVCVRVWLGVCP